MSYTNRLLLIDGYALIYRSHYAMSTNPLLTSKGENTSAAFGFLRTLMDCVEQFQPTHLGVAFDLGGKTFRHELAPDYKANRPPTPPEVKFGVEVVRKFLETLHVTELWAEGYEADDVVGSIAAHFASEETLVQIYSPDKDFQQLLAPHVQLLRPKSMSSGLVVVTEADLLEKYKIKSPRQFIDILALWGDKVDNVPGVPGIGEKRAAALVSEYGGIEYILGNSARFTKHLAEALAQNTAQLMRSLELVRIRLDAPFPAELGRYQIASDVSAEALRALNDQYEFRALGERLVRCFAKGQETAKTVTLDAFCNDVKTLASKEDFDAFCTEITGIADAYSLVLAPEGYALAYQKGEALVVRGFVPQSFDEWSLPWREALTALFEREGLTCYGYDLKEQFHELARQHIPRPRGVLADTLIAHYLLAPERGHELEAIVLQEFHYRLQTEGDLVSMLREQAVFLYRLGERFAERVEVTGLGRIYHELEMPLLPVLFEMEAAGVAVDTSVLESLHQVLQIDLDTLEASIRAVAHDPTLKVSSPKQIGEFLFKELRIAEKPKKTPTGQYNTSEQELAKYSEAHPVVNDILAYRETAKLLSTYIDALPKLVDPATHLIHASFNQAVASTGRLSSSNPNLQNIPVRTEVGRKIRSAFVSRFGKEGVLLSADYSQIELRVLAHMAGDEHMIAAFNGGQDIHAATAARVNGVALEEVSKEMRERAKRVNFGIVYGISAFGLANQLGIPAPEAAAFMKSYFALYPTIETFMRETIAAGRRNGYVQTLWGRRRYLSDLRADNQNVRAAAERMAINMPIQGTAADIIKAAMVQIAGMLRDRGFRALLTTQVHDELIFDVPCEELEALQPLVKETMERVMVLSVPLVVDVATGDNWGAL